MVGGSLWLLTADWPGSVIENLRDPLPVVDVSTDGMVLADGRFQSWGVGGPVPVDLAAIPALTNRGIEVGPDGRAIGLVEVHHWCGNDPIRKHIARVDVGRVLEFLGKRGAPDGPEPLDFTHADARFTKWGWNVSAWWAFERWTGSDPERDY